MLAGMGLVHWQRQVDEQFAEEEVAAGLAVEDQGVLADPAQAGLFGNGFFQHWRTVDEGAVAEGPDDLLDALGQLLHALADQLVVVAAQGIARDVGLGRLGQALGHLGVAGQVVHAQRNHAQGAGHQFRRARALVAVGAHVFHFTVVASGEPAFQMAFVFGKVQAADADLLEAQFAAPVLDELGEGGKILGDDGHEARETDY
ncbi:hypothetical protein P308_02935 [Pseudomonas piscis]|nr:hypothetical protein P308_02935 [Pseudomonas piscis]